MLVKNEEKVLVSPLYFFYLCYNIVYKNDNLC